MKKFILTTGPSLGRKINLNQIHQDKFIYRINGAHGDIESIKNTIINLRKQKADIDILI
ncbi:pyruvate kinase, partial [Campylobacter jejuni]|nr:pyruvate kinase [Campylobacter jejuni]